jgi:hypothetical protein
MLDAVKTMLGNQFDAALCALNVCIDRCPDSSWDAPVANLKFCQAVFHTLFYADYYLGRDDDKDAFRAQPFHRQHAGFFRDYEEFEDRAQTHAYDRPTIRLYVAHCRGKAAAALREETAESLAAPCAFGRRAFSRAELYAYNTRHLQHHAAQLSLRLRLDHGIDVPWVGSGWRNL